MTWRAISANPYRVCLPLEVGVETLEAVLKEQRQ
jgi:hypothetical protein